jgi:hypothetical protein
MQSEKEGQSKSAIIVVDFDWPSASSTWPPCLGARHWRETTGNSYSFTLGCRSQVSLSHHCR